MWITIKICGFVAWATWAWRILKNFEEDIEKMSLWRIVALVLIVTFGAGFFVIEDLLEILLELVVGQE